MIIQNTLNEAHLSKKLRKPIAMAARTTMALDAVLAVSAMPLMLWRMHQLLYSRPPNGLCRTKDEQDSCVAIATPRTTETDITTARTAAI